MVNQRSTLALGLSKTLKNSVWLFGVSAWIFGIIDRSLAGFSDGYLTGVELIQLITASSFFGGWLFLKPSSFWQKRFQSKGGS